MSQTVTYLNPVDGKALAAQMQEQRKKREWQFKQLGAKTSEGVITLPDGTVRGFADGKD